MTVLRDVCQSWVGFIGRPVYDLLPGFSGPENLGSFVSGSTHHLSSGVP